MAFVYVVVLLSLAMAETESDFFPVVVVLPTPVPLPLLFPPLPLPEYKEAKEDADFSDAEFSDFYNFSDDVEFSGITKKEAATEDPNQTVISETWIG